MKNLAVAAAAAALLGTGVAAEQTSRSSPSRVSAPAKTVAAAPALSVESQNQLVGQYCVTCHSERGKAGGLTLAGFDAAAIDRRPDVAEKMIRKLRTGMMPPPSARRPDAATIAHFVDALESTMDAAAAASPNPG